LGLAPRADPGGDPGAARGRRRGPGRGRRDHPRAGRGTDEGGGRCRRVHAEGLRHHPHHARHPRAARRRARPERRHERAGRSGRGTAVVDGGRSVSGEGPALGARLRDGDLSAAPAALNLLESTAAADREEAAALMRTLSPAELGGEAKGHVVGITGPPGAGKSTLLSALIAAWRARGSSVALLAVDPSSRRSGGSLLGDRARIEFDPSDRGVLIRSTAAGERLGGIARPTRAAAEALAAAFDVVVIETVGVGQAETEIADVADTVAVVVQPGSGDVLQFLKSGIMEIPDVLVVTKADLGQIAMRTRRDVAAALRSLGSRETQVVAVSSLPPPQGIDELVQALAQ